MADPDVSRTLSQLTWIVTAGGVAATLLALGWALRVDTWVGRAVLLLVAALMAVQTVRFRAAVRADRQRPRG